MANALHSLLRASLSLALPGAVLDRAPALRGTRFLVEAKLRAMAGKGRPFMLVNVGACDGMLFDDVTPWLHSIPNSRAVLVEPIPYNQKRLRQNFPDTERFRIEPVAIAAEPGRMCIRTFDEAALETGKLPREFVGCSSITDSNLMSGRDAWGREDQNFGGFQQHLKSLEIEVDSFDRVMARNGVDYIDALLIDCEGADWTVFEQVDLRRYRPGMIKIEIGALSAEEIGKTIVKLKTASYSAGLYAEDVWAFA